MNLLLVGYGRMGRLVEQLAVEQGMQIAGRVDVDGTGWAAADVAIDFSTAEALQTNFARYVEMRLPVVIGTTGWQRDEASLREIALREGIGVLAAANFSLGMAVFRAAVQETAGRFAAMGDVGAWIHESHQEPLPSVLAKTR